MQGKSPQEVTSLTLRSARCGQSLSIRLPRGPLMENKTNIEAERELLLKLRDVAGGAP
jgi:hypothetical protein